MSRKAEACDSVAIFLEALAAAVRLYERVPESERSPSEFAGLLEGLLAPEHQSDKDAATVLAEHSEDIQAILSFFREALARPEMSLLDPPSGFPN